MIIKNEEFLFESLRRMAKDYFLFFEVTKREGYNSAIQEYVFRKGDVMMITNNYSIESCEAGYYVNNVHIKSLGNVVGMFDKWLFPKTPNFSATERNKMNKCPLSVEDLQKLLDENYVAIKFIDGSQGWIYSCDDYNAFHDDDDPVEEGILYVTFGDDSFECCFLSNVKEIIYTKPKKIIENILN
ncbi:MAG: hypothetical protein J6580_08520 [Gilliamella sp.]|uniref:hypothetical protein n=1 Tax=Gilliamella sp. TaxID=1891236 RepID=UPI0025FE215D|nr:hypothetical protein [Gilliamella sp.]MCO6550713.1 hypothetical protein [Gilliamella sp.]